MAPVGALAKKSPKSAFGQKILGAISVDPPGDLGLVGDPRYRPPRCPPRHWPPPLFDRSAHSRAERLCSERWSLTCTVVHLLDLQRHGSSNLIPLILGAQVDLTNLEFSYEAMTAHQGVLQGG